MWTPCQTVHDAGNGVQRQATTRYAVLLSAQVKSAPGAGVKLDELVPLGDLTTRLAALLFPSSSSALGMLPINTHASPAAASAAIAAAAAAAAGVERTTPAAGLAPEGR